jgi:outer membrane protein assembly factor BamB
MQRASNLPAGVFVVLTFACGISAVAQDWPQWRGPNRDAKATGFHAPATWPKTLAKKWQVKVGDAVATPALVGGKLYVFTRQHENEILRCLDAFTGDEVWHQEYASAAAQGAAGGFPGPRSSPTVAQGKIVTLGVRGILTCRDAATGKQLWQKEDLAKAWPQFFTSSSPIVVDGMCIAQLGGAKDGGIIAYDLTTGDEKWRWMESGPAYASPVLMTVDGTKVIIAPTDGGRNQGSLVAISATDGKLLWEIPYSEVRYIATTPIVDGSTLIVAGPGTGMSAFKMKKEGDKLVEEKLWTNTDNSVGFNTPVLKDGLVFGITGADQLFCLDTQTQKTAWSAPFANKPAAAEKGDTKGAAGDSNVRQVKAQFVQFVQQDQPKQADEKKGDQPEGGRRGGQGPGRGEGPGRFGPGRGPGGRGGGMRGMATRGYGSIVDVGSALFGLTPAGELIAFKPQGDAFKELARYRVAEGGTYAYPVPAGNGIYIKDQDSMTLWTVD